MIFDRVRAEYSIRRVEPTLPQAFFIGIGENFGETGGKFAAITVEGLAAFTITSLSIKVRLAFSQYRKHKIFFGA